MAEIAWREALNQALSEEMERDANVFLMGEEVARYDGAYKVSQGLLAKFGSARVVDTPISELGFAGLGVGAAMVGLRPVIEMMTWNFAILAMDQIVNNAAKVRQMSGGQLRCPIVFRGPNGAGGRLAAQHSQSLEANYAHFPGLKVVSPSTPADAKGLLKASIRDDNPVIFLEAELLYGVKGEVPEGEVVLPLGQAALKREGADCTVITWAVCTTTATRRPKSSRPRASTSTSSTCVRSNPWMSPPFSSRSERQTVQSLSRRGGASAASAPNSQTSSR